MGGVGAIVEGGMADLDEIDVDVPQLFECAFTFLAAAEVAD